MSANPCRSKDAGRSSLFLVDKKTGDAHEETGFFGNFHEAYWWANQNGFELKQYMALN